MTICTDRLTETKSGKPIEFVSYIKLDNELGKVGTKPKEWEFLDIVGRTDNFDIIKASDHATVPSYYLGHWNDGFAQ